MSNLQVSVIITDDKKELINEDFHSLTLTITYLECLLHEMEARQDALTGGNDD